MTADQWASMVAHHFGFLAEAYGLQVSVSDDTDAWETTVTYSRDPVAVIVRYSIEFERAEVELVRMVDGRIPAVLVFILPDSVIDRSLLDSVLRIRSPQGFSDLKAHRGLDVSSLNRSLAFQAAALQLHAADFLKGDLSIFDQVGRLLKDGIADNPPTVTAIFPEGASRPEQDATVAKIRDAYPGVQIRRSSYKRPRKSGPYS